MFKKNVSADSLNLKAANVLNVFKATITGLNEVIDSANNQAEEQQKIIDAAAQEKENLLKVAAENKAIVDKISGLLV